MKVEEAIRAIELIKEMDVNTPITQVDIANVEWAKEMAIEALERKIPVKPIVVKDTLYCPKCSTTVAKNRNIAQHCWVCGQAILAIELQKGEQNERTTIVYSAMV